MTDSRKTPQEIEPWVEGRPFTKEADWDYYAERVAQTLARVTEVYDWDASALLGGTRQRRLGGSERMPPPEPGPAATLDTPLSEVGARTKRRTTNKSLADWQ